MLDSIYHTILKLFLITFLVLKHQFLSCIHKVNVGVITKIRKPLVYYQF